MNTIEIKREISCKGHYDVIVAGGGVAGAAAAVAAARQGKSVLLVEKSQKLGGLATLGLINLFVPMCNGRGKQIIFGMAEEFLRLSIKWGYDTLPKGWEQGGEYRGEPCENPPRYVTRYSAEIFALALTELMQQEGVTLMYDSVVSLPVMSDTPNGKHCDGVVLENKSGAEYYTAGMVVDVTGDADVLARAGVPTVTRGNFDTFTGFAITLESCRKAAESGNIHSAVTGVAGGNATLYGQRHPAGYPLYNGTDSAEVNRYLIRNHVNMLESIRSDERFSRDILTLPGMAQFRTTRRIEGDYVLQEEDAYRHFDDSIGAINDFDRRDLLFEVPYRTLVNSGFDNLITAGRSAAGNKFAWDVLRVIPPAIITGQAAGTAAALCLDANRPIYAPDIAAVQDALARANVMIHFDDALIPENPVVNPVMFENVED